MLVDQSLGRARRPRLGHGRVVGGREVAGEKHARLRRLDLRKHGAPVRHGAFGDAVVGEHLPAQLLDLVLETGGDYGAIGALATDDRAGLGLGVEKALVQGAVDPVRKALSVPGLGRVALEDAPVLARVRLVALQPGDLRVDVVVQRAGVGDDVELGAGGEVVAREDHIGLLDAGRPVEGGRDLICGRVLVVDLDVVEVVADEPAAGVDLVDRHLHAVGHLFAVRRDDATGRKDAHHLDAAPGSASNPGR